MLSAGLVCTATRAARDPALAKWCTVPGGIRTVSPGPAVTRRPPTRNFSCPSSTVKHSSCSGWAWLLGTRPPGASTSSQSSSVPPVSAAVARIVICSPLRGFSMTCPPSATAASRSGDISPHRRPGGCHRDQDSHACPQRRGGREGERGHRGNGQVGGPEGRAAGGGGGQDIAHEAEHGADAGGGGNLGRQDH